MHLLSSTSLSYSGYILILEVHVFKIGYLSSFSQISILLLINCCVNSCGTSLYHLLTFPNSINLRCILDLDGPGSADKRRTLVLGFDYVASLITAASNDGGLPVRDSSSKLKKPILKFTNSIITFCFTYIFKSFFC